MNETKKIAWALLELHGHIRSDPVKGYACLELSAAVIGKLLNRMRMVREMEKDGQQGELLLHPAKIPFSLGQNPSTNDSEQLWHDGAVELEWVPDFPDTGEFSLEVRSNRCRLAHENQQVGQRVWTGELRRTQLLSMLRKLEPARGPALEL